MQTLNACTVTCPTSSRTVYCKILILREYLITRSRWFLSNRENINLRTWNFFLISYNSQLAENNDEILKFAKSASSDFSRNRFLACNKESTELSLQLKRRQFHTAEKNLDKNLKCSIVMSIGGPLLANQERRSMFDSLIWWTN